VQMGMVYLSFVQQLDRDADGARHGEDVDANFLFGCDGLLRTAVAKNGTNTTARCGRGCVARVGQSSMVGCLTFGERSKLRGIWRSSPISCSADQINNYISRSTERTR